MTITKSDVLDNATMAPSNVSEDARFRLSGKVSLNLQRSLKMLYHKKSSECSIGSYL